MLVIVTMIHISSMSFICKAGVDQLCAHGIILPSKTAEKQR